MGQTIARMVIGLGSTAALAIGVLGLVHSLPKWVWISLGAIGLIGIAAQFALDNQRRGDKDTAKLKQQQRGGRGSTNLQAGRDINLGDKP